MMTKRYRIIYTDNIKRGPHFMLYADHEWQAETAAYYLKDDFDVFFETDDGWMTAGKHASNYTALDSDTITYIENEIAQDLHVVVHPAMLAT